MQSRVCVSSVCCRAQHFFSDALLPAVLHMSLPVSPAFFESTCFESMRCEDLHRACAASCRYYVEDHSNQLVRTFTGNLTKMLSQMPTSLRASGSSEGEAARGSSTATKAGGAAGGAADGGQAASQSTGGDWSATRLMQVGTSWGSGFHGM